MRQEGGGEGGLLIARKSEKLESHGQQFSPRK